jgi:hypothetical protein
MSYLTMVPVWPLLCFSFAKLCGLTMFPLQKEDKAYYRSAHTGKSCGVSFPVSTLIRTVVVHFCFNDFVHLLLVTV